MMAQDVGGCRGLQIRLQPPEPSSSRARDTSACCAPADLLGFLQPKWLGHVPFRAEPWLSGPLLSCATSPSHHLEASLGHYQASAPRYQGGAECRPEAQLLRQFQKKTHDMARQGRAVSSAPCRTAAMPGFPPPLASWRPRSSTGSGQHHLRHPAPFLVTEGPSRACLHHSARILSPCATDRWQGKIQPSRAPAHQPTACAARDAEERLFA